MKALGRIEKAADDGSWQASAWLLERKHPGEWARKDRNKTLDPEVVTAAIRQLESEVAELEARDATANG